jgi:hypothetical protein
MPSTTSSSSSCPATPSRGSLPTVTSAMSDTRVGDPSRARSMVLRMSSIDRIWPTARTTADCGPRLTVLAPTLTLALFNPSITCFSVSP